MKHWLKRGWALVLAACLLCMPLLGLAGDYAAGTMLGDLQRELYAAGREFVYTIEADLTGTALAGSTGSMLKATLDRCALRVTAADDIDRQLYGVTLLDRQGNALLTLNAVLAGENLTVTSPQIPGEGLQVPLSALPYDPRTLLNMGASEDMNALLDAYINYYFVVGAWVSNTQTEQEDLYINERDLEIPETELRDAVVMTQSHVIRSRDFLLLIRGLADTFYDDDASQQSVANLLAPLGVTRQDVRHFADQLPVLIAHELSANENMTTFRFSQNEEREAVGFDGVMPKLTEPFLFDNGTYQYDLKNVEGEKRAHAKGTIEFFDGGVFAGEASWVLPEPTDEQVSRQGTLAVDWPLPAMESAVSLQAAANDAYTVVDNKEQYTADLSLSGRVQYGQTELQPNVTVKVQGETALVGDQDMTHQTQIILDAGDALRGEIRMTIATGDYAVPEVPAKLYVYGAMTPEEDAAFNDTLMTLLMQLLSAISG